MSLSWMFFLLTFSSPVTGDYFLKGSKNLKEKTSSCQKYILLTTQRSGSTWTCNLFDMQDGVTCGGTKTLYEGVFRISELLIEYSYLGETGRAAVEWSQYEKDLSDAIQDSVDGNESCNPSIQSSNVDLVNSAAGFKLMYDQIPQQFIDNHKIFDYFVKNDIAIVHLIREAKILQISSHEQSQGMPDGQPHTADKSVVISLRQRTKPMIWDETTIQQVFLKEETDAKWESSFLSYPNLKYHKLIYENMLQKEKRNYELDSVFDFLNANQDSKLNLDSYLLQLHEPTCESRIDRYEEFYEKITGTKTLTACKKLNIMFGDEETEGTRI